MKTEKELLELYDGMLESERELRKVVDTPPTGMDFHEIQEHIIKLNQQCAMNDLLGWILNKKDQYENRRTNQTT